MAAWWRAQLSAQVIAVTGSAGKTTTKGLIAHLLSGFSSGTAAEKSFNNHIGVPYTICSIDKEDAWAVLEIGMNHPGEIETLSALAKPDVAVVTSVGPVHIGHFSSIDDIAKEKFAISKGLTDDGQLVLNSDVFSVIGKKKAESLIFGSPQISTIGIEEDDSLRVSDVVVDGLDGVAFRLSNATDTFECASKLLCSVNSFNSGIAVLAAQTAFPDLKLSELCDRLATFEPPPLRLNTIRLSENRIVINDSYNANPISMAASLELLSSLQQRGAKVGAIVGDMLELGEFADRYHNEIAERIAAIPMSFVAAVGEHASELLAPSAELGVVVQVCESPEEAAQFAANQSFDIVLIKASRGIALDKAASELCSILGQ
jgi:UDP-N-acetylmuramoyl-tripeptide--D-alanyl-D-alanine ligase